MSDDPKLYDVIDPNGKTLYLASTLEGARLFVAQRPAEVLTIQRFVGGRWKPIDGAAGARAIQRSRQQHLKQRARAAKRQQRAAGAAMVVAARAAARSADNVWRVSTEGTRNQADSKAHAFAAAVDAFNVARAESHAARVDAIEAGLKVTGGA